MDHVAADDRAAAIVVVIGEDRKCRRIRAGPRVINGEITLILRPAEIRTRSISRVQEINFFAATPPHVGNNYSSAVKRKPPGITEAIGKNFAARSWPVHERI